MPQALQIDTIVASLSPEQRELVTIEVLDEVDSTNDWCVRQSKTGAELPIACFAGQQSAGKGRRGRHWYSPAAANIYMSLAWQFDERHDELGSLSLVIGMMVRDTLREAGVDRAMLKWPNDVLVDNKKIAGVLIETVFQHGELNAVVIGVGINVGMPDKVAPEQNEWTDVAQESGSREAIDRDELAGLLLSNCMSICRRFERDPVALQSELQACFSTPIPVDVLTESGERVSGTMRGITELGELRITEITSGRERIFNSADVSLRQH